MHMSSDSVPSLRPEDRPDFERALEAALRSIDGETDDGADGEPPLSAEQLRAMALSAVEPIVACAAPEYQQYLKQRDEAELDRGPSLSMASAEPSASGAGLFAVVAVLTPILAGTAAVIFLILGYVLHAVQTPEPSIAQPLRTAGWLFAAIASFGILAGMVGLLCTALRNGPTATADAGRAALPPEVADARDLWLGALVERGVGPFLEEAVRQAADAPSRDDWETVPDDLPGPSAHISRMPRLGYSRPDFSSPSDGDDPAGRGPRFSSPRFSSPDFGGSDFSGPESEAH
jgi:hypothetical protein